MALLEKIFGTYSERQLKKNKSTAQAVLDLDREYSQLSEAELKAKTAHFKNQLDNGASLDEILPDAFATVREAAYRVLGMKHFPVQVQGGIILHQGRIAEMKTGEGKTLVATLPVYLNALSGKGVHVVTVNDYLAKRDSEWMGKVYRYLGLDVGLIVHGLSKAERRKSYAADVTYGTNNEFGFDYLRDNMVMSLDRLVQRELNFAIVDEVDSILIDEARTPLIISGHGSESSELYNKADSFARGLRKKVIIQEEAVRTAEEMEEIEAGADYIVDEKASSATLTKSGVAKAEKFFGIDNLADQENYEINHHINNALKAYGTMHRDQDYVVKDDEVIIVDDFTGRLMFGRRYSNGLHQAIEAKEGVTINAENKTLATITFQNYFRMYNKLSGMTGTALTEEDEFREIYALDVVSIPTNKPMIRDDRADHVYKTQRGKYQRIVEEVKRVHETGQPILVGTVSVDTSEMLSQMFSRAGIPHNVLNAKYHEREAEIVAQAGRLNAVTIATNMAGRGTDIMLGGNPEFMARQEMRKQGYDYEMIEQATAYNATDDQEILKARKQFSDLEKQFSEDIKEEKQAVIDCGGLYILGTERHESRRVDNQLRGRAGRQGDPGVSCFYLSLEDDLMRLFGGDRMDRIFESLGVEENVEISHPMLSSVIESAQKRVEGRNFSIRKNVLQYDDVMNQQRNLIYAQRREVLEGKDLHPFYQRITKEVMKSILSPFIASYNQSGEWDLVGIKTRVVDVFGELPLMVTLENKLSDLSPELLSDQLTEQALNRLEERSKDLGSEELLREAERVILLQTVDKHWMDHIDAMDDLRDSIGMRGYAQHDPVVEYRIEGYDMFEEMNYGIKEDSVRLIMRARLIAQPVARKDPQITSEGRGSSGYSATELEAFKRAQKQAGQRERAAESAGQGRQIPVKKAMRPGRNDPCWCGSGKKYKNCHLAQDEKEDLGA